MAQDQASLEGTALHRAVCTVHGPDVQEVLADGGDLNARDKSEMTALHISVMQAHTHVIFSVLESGKTFDGFDVNAVNNIGDTALHIAARRNLHRAVSLLIGRGAHVFIRNAAGQKPLDVTWTRRQCTTDAHRAVRSDIRERLQIAAVPATKSAGKA